jgi:hypothetical protein
LPAGTFTPEDCETPSTFTTPVRTLVVAPSEAELAARKQQEEAAAKKQQEEQVTKRKAEAEAAEEAAASGRVVLDGLTVGVENSRAAAIRLTCRGVLTCMGKLTLTARAPAGKGATRHARPETVGTARYSIGAGKNATIAVTLDKNGRSLLSAAHGQLSATLAIFRTSPLPRKTQVEHVRLDVKAEQAK